MRIRKVALFILCLTIGFLSCNKDDNNTITVEIRDRSEQQIIDNDSIVGYLETHYYNKRAFEGNTDPNISDLVISEVTSNMTISSDADSLLINAVETKTVNYAETDYEFYILKLNQGGGDSPTFADNIRVNYEGLTLDDDVFDSRGLANPEKDPLDLVSLVVGWRKVLPYFNSAEGFVENVDGTLNYFNTGLGVMFLPSGLAYFSSAKGSVSEYSPLIFKFELLQVFQNDHDEDGVPSYLEDLNGNGELLSVDLLSGDDDTDGDGIPNYLDTDDDGDGILTINEDIDGDGNPANDVGKNGIPKYLDPEEKESKV